jgi:hypothetical protein
MTVINRGMKLVASPGSMITHFAIQGQSVCILYEIPNLFLFVSLLYADFCSDLCITFEIIKQGR